MTTKWFALVALAFAAAMPTGAAAVAARSDIPETVLITYRPKPGAEAELAQVIARHWTTARQLNLVQAEPHLTLQMNDETRRPCVVDIFTWRDGEIPDSAPAPILKIWDDMARLTETRETHPGIEITRVSLVREPQS